MGNCIQRFTPVAAGPAAFISLPAPEPAVPLTLTDLSRGANELIAAFLNPNLRNEFRLTNRQAARDKIAATHDIVVRNRIDLHRAIATYSPGGLYGVTLNGDSFTDDDLLLLPSTLKRLKLVQCAAISEHGMANLDALQGLQEIDLSRQRNLSDAGLQALQHLPLQRLDLRGCNQITDAGLTQLPHTLTDLSLRNCRLISDIGLAHLAPLALEKLNLDHCRAITDDGIAALPRTLQDLSMIGCDGVQIHTEEPMAGMSLKTLNMNNRDHLDGTSLQFLPQSLTQLSLSDWYRLTDAGVAHLMRMRLTDLDLGDCLRISNAALASLGLHQPTIKRLNLTNCTLIDDAGLAALAGLPIEELTLNGCYRVLNQGLHYLADFPLKKLNMIGCFRTTQGGRANFAALEQFTHTQIEF